MTTLLQHTRHSSRLTQQQVMKFKRTKLAACVALALGSMVSFEANSQNTITGDVSPSSFSGTNWDLNGGSWGIGSTSTGEVDVTSAVITNVNSIYLGGDPTGDGTFNLAGSSSSLQAALHFWIGLNGTGEVSVSDGATVTHGGNVWLGRYSTSTGTLTISDVGTSFVQDDMISVGGYGGDGTLIVKDGAYYKTNNNMYIGSYIMGGKAANGEVTISGANTHAEIAGGILVGERANGTVSISDGAKVSSSSGSIGVLRNSSVTENGNGTVTVSGPDSTWEVQNNLTVGAAGQGTLTIEDQAKLVSDSMTIGNSQQTSTVTLTGPAASGSTLEITNALVVGGTGRGKLEVNAGATITSGSTVLAQAATGWADVELKGAGTTWTNAGSFVVGESGLGILYMRDGANLSSGSVVIGQTVAGFGSITLRGAGTTWTNAGTFVLGEAGRGTITIGNQARLVSDSMTIGNAANYSNTVTISGPASSGSTLEITNALVVGGTGAGELQASAGATITSGSAAMGQSAGGVGNVGLTGAGTTWTNAGTLVVGEAGQGILTIGNRAQLVSDSMTIGNSQQTSMVTLTGPASSGSTLEITNALVVGGTGSGTLSANAGATIASGSAVIGQSAGGVGNVTLDGAGTTWTNTGTFVVGEAGRGSLTIENLAKLVSDSMTIGNATGPSSGVTVSGPAASGSTLEIAGALVVGGTGSGQLQTIAGATIVSGSTVLGQTGASRGSVILNGAGTLWTNAGTFVVGDAGEGSLTIGNRAQLVSDSMTIGNTAGISNTVALNGPASSGLSLEITNALVVGGTGSGSLGAHTDATISSGSAVIGQSASGAGSVTLNGAGTTWTNAGTFVVGDAGQGSLTIGDQAKLVSDSLTIGNAADQSSMLFSGPVSNGSTIEITNAVVVGGTGSGRLSAVAGATMTSGSAVIGQSAGGVGSATLRGAGTTWTNAGTFVVGDAGQGSLVIEAQAKLVSDSMTIGNMVGQLSTVELSDSASSGSTLEIADALVVGGTGSGSLQAYAGATITSGSAVISQSAGGVGSATLRGAGTTWTNAGTFVVGEVGQGWLTIETQAKLVSDSLTVGNSVGPASLVTLNGSAASGSTLEIVDALVVGGTGSGNLSASAGATISSGSAVIGQGADGVGTAALSGAGTTWTNAGTFVVGDAGNGLLTIDDHAKLVSDSLIVGNSTGQQSAVLISSAAGSVNLDVTNALVVGGTSSGTLQALVGSTIISGSTVIGQSTDGDGTVLLNGIDTTLTSAVFVVGDAGKGQLETTAGATITSGSAVISQSAGGAGTAMLRNTGTTWTNSGTFVVGGAAKGLLTIENQAKLVSNSLTIGNAAGPDASRVTLNGSASSGSTLEITNALVVGGTGSGELRAGAGATIASASAVISQSVGGSGSAMLNGAGTRWINAGTFVVGDAGQGSLTIQDQATLVSDSMTIGNSAGPQSEVLASTGSNLVITTALVVGGTTGGGALQASEGATLTSGSVMMGQTANGMLNTGVLSHTGTTWTNAGAFVVGDAGQASLSITDGATLLTGHIRLANQAGSAGALYLSGTDASRGVIATNYIAGGSGAATMFVDGGILRFMSDGDAMPGVTNMDVGNQGVFIDTQGHTLSIATNMLNAGGVGQTVGMVKQGSGTLTLSGTSTTVGTNYLQAGQVRAVSPTPFASMTYHPVLGTGNIIVASAAQSAGLEVAHNVQLPNQVIVNNQGRLSGAGQVGSAVIHAGGVIAPDVKRSATDALTVGGDLTMHAGSSYEINLETGADLLIVKGVANLSGTVLDISQHAVYDAAKRYTILTADRGVVGQFDEAKSQNFSYITLVPRYDIANMVYLFVERNGNSFEDFAYTPNQKATAKALEGIPGKNAEIYRYILNLPKGEPAAMFDALSGEIHATAQHSMFNAANSVALSSLQALRNNLMSPLACNAEDNQAMSEQKRTLCAGPAWAQISGDWRQQNSDGNAATSKDSTYGLMIGFDQEIAQSGWRLGGTFAYARSTVNVSDRNSSADVDNYSFGLYGGKAFAHGANQLNVLAGISFTQHSISTQRNVTRLGQQLTTNYTGQTYQMFGEVGYAIAVNPGLKVEPFAGFAVSSLRLGGFRESGGFAGLNANNAGAQTHTSSTLGVRTYSDFTVGKSKAQINASLGWRHVWGQYDVTRTMSFNAGSPEFMIAAVPIPSNTAVVGLSGQVEIGRNSWLELSYIGQFGKGLVDQGAMLNVRMAF